MEWISVKDRLPMDEEDYLCSFIGWDDMVFNRVMVWDLIEDCWFDWCGMEYKTVTHWMPLPAPPTK